MGANMLVSHFSTVTLALRHVTRQKFYHGYRPQGRREGGGNWGILPWAPLCLWVTKDRYTLIEQSNTLLKQSLHIFCPGPLKLSLLPWLHGKIFYFRTDSIGEYQTRHNLQGHV